MILRINNLLTGGGAGAGESAELPVTSTKNWVLVKLYYLLGKSALMCV